MKNDRPSSAPLPDPSPVEFGGRVELRLVTSPDPQAHHSEKSDPSDAGSSKADGAGKDAVYAARWFTSELSLQGEVSVSDSGKSIHVSAPDELPEWLSTFTTTLVRTTARSATQDNSWPRRLTRWRKAPDSER